MKFISLTKADSSAIPALDDVESISFGGSTVFKVTSVEDNLAQARTEAEEGQDVLLLSFSLEDGETLKVDDTLTGVSITKDRVVKASINYIKPSNKTLGPAITAMLDVVSKN